MTEEQLKQVERKSNGLKSGKFKAKSPIWGLLATIVLIATNGYYRNEISSLENTPIQYQEKDYNKDGDLDRRFYSDAGLDQIQYGDGKGNFYTWQQLREKYYSDLKILESKEKRNFASKKRYLEDELIKFKIKEKGGCE